MSVNWVDLYVAALRLGKYAPLFTSTSVNNCPLFTEHKACYCLRITVQVIICKKIVKESFSKFRGTIINLSAILHKSFLCFIHL